MRRPSGRRQEILDTFIRHVAERGYHATNFGDIASELGMSQGTIVYHFGSKAQLLRELEESCTARHIAHFEEMRARLTRAEERVAAVVYFAALLFTTDRDLTVASQREVAQLAFDPGFDKVREGRRELVRMTEDFIRQGISDGTFRQVNVELAAVQLWSALQLMWVWFNPDGLLTAQQVGAAFVDTFLGGLLVDRYNLAQLADPAGHVAEVTGEVLAGLHIDAHAAS
ncbi:MULTISPECIES: TetR/AcrR family transcriptional regulator [unclassified Mycobacterium]|uniref:TetR/AcrR family transcriptional regulator n=1 Tax=unclassified Mycobacterium TaxID=2642494 RepID=UPI00048BA9AC|nr:MULTISPECIES: TetR/AcrR family transcriptional regulator [unclassified Mycobacterium]SEA60348.1 DNA-binding transcriptional regulator, AcrR family [Mycobacterium sp. 283mftsu]